MANEEDARDIAQESLTRLLRYRETEPASSWKPLLYRIATNVMGEQFRRASARQATRHVPLEGMEIASGAPAARKSGVSGKSVSVSVDLGGGRVITKKIQHNQNTKS